MKPSTIDKQSNHEKRVGRAFLDRLNGHLAERPKVITLPNTDQGRRDAIATLISQEYQDNELCMDLDCMVKDYHVGQALPVVLTFDKDTWLLIARLAHHRKCTYGEIVSECFTENGLATLCQKVDEEDAGPRRLKKLNQPATRDVGHGGDAGRAVRRHVEPI